MDGHGP
jgi:hypothetical protein